MKKLFAGLVLAAAMMSTAAAAPTVEILRIESGIACVILDATEENLVIAQITGFSASTRDFSRLPLTGPTFPVTGTGSDVVIASEAAINAVAGGDNAGVVSVAQVSNGDFLVWNEEFRGGSDTVLRITPAGVVTTEIAIGDVDPAGVPGGIEAMATAANDTLFAWSQFPAGGGTVGLYVFPSPYSAASRITITRDDIATGVNAVVPNTATSASGVRAPIGGMAVYEPSASNDIILAISDINNNAVYGLTFDRTNLTAAPTYSVLVGREQLQTHTGQAVIGNVRQRTIAFDQDGFLYLYSGQGVADADAKLVKADVLTNIGTPTFETIATQAELIAGATPTAPQYANIQYNFIQVDSTGAIYMGLYSGTPVGRIIKVTPGVTTVQDWLLF